MPATTPVAVARRFVAERQRASPKSSTCDVVASAVEHHHVLELEIAMDDAECVRRFERVAQLHADARHAGRRHRAAALHELI